VEDANLSDHRAHERDRSSRPVGGGCTHCGSPRATSIRKDEAWYCCAACGGSDRCGCGCKPEFAAEPVGAVFVPTRRMFAARAADGLKRENDDDNRDRAFPFADKARGR
jgi:hypothetical protein